MANEKYTLNVSDEQIDRLKKALHAGSPLEVALTYADISNATYFYWIEIASVVEYCRELDEIKQQDENIESGVSYTAIKENVQEQQKANKYFKSSLRAFKEPSGNAILKYRNNRNYKKYADMIYGIIKECDMLRSEIILYHLTAIRDSARQKGGNANSSQWFLERTMPQYFGKADRLDTTESAKISKVKVEFINPDTKENRDRVKEMESLVVSQMGSPDGNNKA